MCLWLDSICRSANVPERSPSPTCLLSSSARLGRIPAWAIRSGWKLLPSPGGNVIHSMLSFSNTWIFSLWCGLYFGKPCLYPSEPTSWWVVRKHFARCCCQRTANDQWSVLGKVIRNEESRFETLDLLHLYASMSLSGNISIVPWQYFL